MYPHTALILAGGFGTRLKEVVQDVPKPMAPINKEPFLSYILKHLKQYGIKHVVLCTGYLHPVIENHYKNSFESIDISYSVETNPLGTGGAIKKALSQVNDKEVFILNGDSFMEVDLKAFHEFYKTTKAQTAIVVRKVLNASRYGTITLNTEKKITAFHEKSSNIQEGLINTGVYLIDKSNFLENIPQEENFSIEKDFFEKKINELTIYGFECEGYFIDIGIPEDYQRAQHEFKKFATR